MGKTENEVEKVFEKFQQMVTAEKDGAPEGLGKLTVLEGVRQFPLRIKCATLVWHTLRAALAEGKETVTTE